MKKEHNKEKKRKAPISPSKSKKSPNFGKRKEGDHYYTKPNKKSK